MPRTPAPWARVAPLLQATPTRLVFDNIAPPSLPTTTPEPSPLPLLRVLATPSPIDHHTRSCLAPQFLGGIGTISCPDGQNNMVSTHFGLLICRPMPSAGTFGT